MTKFLTLAVAALAGLALSSEAGAREPKHAPPQDARMSNDDSGKSRMEPRYCVYDSVQGSRVAHKTCKTRQKWLAGGFDPLNP